MPKLPTMRVMGSQDISTSLRDGVPVDFSGAMAVVIKRPFRLRTMKHESTRIVTNECSATAFVQIRVDLCQFVFHRPVPRRASRGHLGMRIRGGVIASREDWL